MIRSIRALLKAGIGGAVRVAEATAIGGYVSERLLNTAMEKTQSITHRGTSLCFVVPNRLNRYRIATFSTKEPETLEWIDRIPRGSVVWDIGANVGLYSCYAAKARDCRVYSFEPSVFNLELLARNIHLNSLSERVTIIPLPLSDSLASSTLNMTSTEWGGALSSFGQAYGQSGQPMTKVFEFKTIGLSMLDARDRLGIPQPEYIKMDVDGIEHLILAGGADVLRKTTGVLAEIDETFQQQLVDSGRYLSAAGLVLKEKRPAALSEDVNCFNQIWSRP